MKINCIYCKSDFICEDQKFNLENSIVKCGHCLKEWHYESQLSGLEKRIEDLDKELENNEKRLKDEKKFNIEKIDQLEIELKNKKLELEQQKLIQDKLYLYEQRLTRAEKGNSEQAILEDKIFKLREEIGEQSSEIINNGKEIDRKTNYLMMKSKSENKLTPKIKKMNEKITNNIFTKKNEQKNDTKLKKYNFWKM